MNLTTHIIRPLILNSSTAALVVRCMSSSSRQSRILNKLVVGKVKTKRKWFIDGDIPKMPSAASLSNPARQGKNAPRRVVVLNKLFMKYITDLMTSGEVAESIQGKGVEISFVKVTSDFQFVNVFWSAKGSQDHAETEIILKKSSGILRHELSQLRLMGEVPKIIFVKDKQGARSSEVDELLAIADFGDDYEPSQWHQLKHDLIPSAGQLSDDLPLPAMRHDVFGLNQLEIMDKIKSSMSKSKQAWDKYENHITNQIIGDNSATSAISLSDVQEQVIKFREEEFAKFIENRKLQKKISKRLNKIENYEYERETYDTDNEDLSSKFDGTEDYLEEDMERRP